MRIVSTAALSAIILLLTPVAFAQEMLEAGQAVEAPSAIENPNADEHKGRRDRNDPNQPPKNDRKREPIPADAEEPAEKAVTSDTGEREAADKAQQQREIEDLAAQKEMADWARYSANVGWFAALFGGLSALAALFATILLWRTLAATRAMIAEAEKATAAANATVDATREIGRDQMRGYISVEQVTIDFRGSYQNGFTNGRHDALGFVIWVKNSGLTPITKYALHYRARIVLRGDIPKTFATESGVTPTWGSLHVGRSLSFSIDDRPLAELIHNAADGDDSRYLMLDGRVEFDTIFGETRREYFKVSADAHRIRDYRRRRSTYRDTGESKPDPLFMPFAALQDGEAEDQN